MLLEILHNLIYMTVKSVCVCVGESERKRVPYLSMDRDLFKALK